MTAIWPVEASTLAGPLAAYRVIERPEQMITASYHVEFFERGYWHTWTEHVCEAHARANQLRFDGCEPTRIVKVTTAVERRIIE